MSATVTVDIQVDVLAFASATVNVTLFVPISAQVNDVMLGVKLDTPQLSLEPPSISDPVMVAFPDPSKNTVMFWHTAVGLVVSTTVTMAVHVELFAFASVTVNVTLFVPISAQVNDVMLGVKLDTPQLSLEPPSISDPVMVAFPAPSKNTVMF